MTFFLSLLEGKRTDELWAAFALPHLRHKIIVSVIARALSTLETGTQERYFAVDIDKGVVTIPKDSAEEE